jgi:phosphate-selective porin OprO/OprP
MRSIGWLAAWVVSSMAATMASAQDEPAPSRVTVDKGGLKVESGDGAFQFRISGRLHADGTVHVGETPSSSGGTNNDATDGVEIRRARIFVNAKVYEDFNWTGEVDFADNETAVKDFFMGYSGIEHLNLMAGHQKQPYSLAVEMSSNDLPFTERSIDNDLIIPLIDRAIGGRFETFGEKWYVAGGFYGESMEPQSVNATEGWGSAAKVVFTPIIAPDRVVHLGFRGAVRRPENANESLRFRDETTHMSDYRVVDTGTIENIQEAAIFGPEAAVAFGLFSLFGEYNRAHITRKGANTLEFQSGHIGATWSLTGESRAATYTIQTGEFKRLAPKNNFSLKHGGAGAWELAVRYAYIDLSSGSASGVGSVNGGEEHAFDASINWYLNPVVRMMLGWKHVLETSIGQAASATTFARNQEGKGLNAFTFRTQFAF